MQSVQIHLVSYGSNKFDLLCLRRTSNWFFLLCPVCKYIWIHRGSTFGYLLKNSFLFIHPWSIVTSLNDKFTFTNSIQAMFSKWMKNKQKRIFQMFFIYVTKLKKTPKNQTQKKTPPNKKSLPPLKRNPNRTKKNLANITEFLHRII